MPEGCARFATQTHTSGTLGRSAQAKLLEAQLAGLTVPNVLADALGMLVVLVLWRRVVIGNDWLL